jgi:hypothetical protein
MGCGACMREEGIVGEYLEVSKYGIGIFLCIILLYIILCIILLCIILLCIILLYIILCIILLCIILLYIILCIILLCIILFLKLYLKAAYCRKRFNGGNLTHTYVNTYVGHFRSSAHCMFSL